MKKINLVIALSFLCFAVISCGGKESAASIAKDWCELNGKVSRSEGAAKDAAKDSREKFEEKMEKKYGNDKAFMDEIEKEIEKCEAASEGR